MHAPHSGVSGSKRRGLRDISNTPLQVDVSTPFKSIDPKFGTPVSKKRRLGTPSEKFLAQKNSNCKYHVDSGKSKQRVVKFGTPGPSYRIGTAGAGGNVENASSLLVVGSSSNKPGALGGAGAMELSRPQPGTPGPSYGRAGAECGNVVISREAAPASSRARLGSSRANVEAERAKPAAAETGAPRFGTPGPSYLSASRPPLAPQPQAGGAQHVPAPPQSNQQDQAALAGRPRAFGTPGPSYASSSRGAAGAHNVIKTGTPGPSYAGASTKKTPTFGASSGAGTLVVQGVSAGSRNAAQESGQVPHEFRFAGDQSNPIGAARSPSLHHSAFSRPAFPGLRPNAAPTFGVAGGQHQVPMQTPGRYASGSSGPDVHMTTSQAAAGGEEHVDVVDELEQIAESPIFNVDDEFSLRRSPFIEPAAEASKPLLHAKGDASTSAAAGAQEHEDRGSANITAAPYPPIQGFCDDRTEEAKRAAAIGQPLLPDMDLSMGERRQISQVLNKLFPNSGSEFTSTTNAAHKNCSAKSSPSASSSSPFERAAGGAPSSRQSRNNAFLLEEGEDIAFEDLDLPSPRFAEDGSTLRDVTSGQPAAAGAAAGQRPEASFADLEFRAAPTLF